MSFEYVSPFRPLPVEDAKDDSMESFSSGLPSQLSGPAPKRLALEEGASPSGAASSAPRELAAPAGRGSPGPSVVGSRVAELEQRLKLSEARKSHFLDRRRQTDLAKQDAESAWEHEKVQREYFEACAADFQTRNRELESAVEQISQGKDVELNRLLAQLQSAVQDGQRLQLAFEKVSQELNLLKTHTSSLEQDNAALVSTRDCLIYEKIQMERDAHKLCAEREKQLLAQHQTATEQWKHDDDKRDRDMHALSSQVVSLQEENGRLQFQVAQPMSGVPEDVVEEIVNEYKMALGKSDVFLAEKESIVVELTAEIESLTYELAERDQEYAMLEDKMKDREAALSSLLSVPKTRDFWVSK